jgi:type IV secretory pathway VirB10-like protein
MFTNRAALAALAVVGVVAAGGGAYIASRQHPAPESPSVAARDVNLPSGPSAVTETENSLAPAPEPVPAPAATEAAVKPAAPLRPAHPAAPRSRAQAAERSRTAYPSSTSPSSAPASGGAAASTSANPPVNAAVEPVESTTVERRSAAPEPPQKQFEELVVPADSVIGLQIETAITSERAKVEDPVKARVARDVKVKDQVAIPAGSRAEGSITLVEKGGKLKDQARLGIRFHTIVLADGTRLPINTETIYRDGESPAGESAAKIGGGAVGGAVLGAILGGKKGAIIGSTVGAGAGSAAVMASTPSTATLPAGSTVTVRMSSPATVTVEK